MWIGKINKIPASRVREAFFMVIGKKVTTKRTSYVCRFYFILFFFHFFPLKCEGFLCSTCVFSLKTNAKNNKQNQMKSIDFRVWLVHRIVIAFAEDRAHDLACSVFIHMHIDRLLLIWSESGRIQVPIRRPA